jgi:hypothetical protein
VAGKIRIEMETIVSKMGLPEPESEAQLREMRRLQRFRGIAAKPTNSAIKFTQIPMSAKHLNLQR